VVVQAPLSVRPVGFVVAGGRSTRMGRDKALLPWQGSTLLDHAIARLSAVCGEVRILCGPGPRYEDRGRPLVVDAIPDGGPLAGIAAGLESAGDAAGVYLGVDLPHVPVALLEMLIALTDADAIVPVTPGGPEPLCAVYGPGCRDAVRARLAAGDRRMTSFWPDVRVRTVEGAALAAFGDPQRIFHNVNAPADYLGLAGDTQ
jgi:molybdopterin-guanine dinucleotide biosynthesis protein A